MSVAIATRSDAKNFRHDSTARRMPTSWSDERFSLTLPSPSMGGMCLARWEGWRAARRPSHRAKQILSPRERENRAPVVGVAEHRSAALALHNNKSSHADRLPKGE